MFFLFTLTERISLFDDKKLEKWHLLPETKQCKLLKYSFLTDKVLFEKLKEKMTTNKKTSGITIEIISFKWNVFPYQTEHKNVQLQGLDYQLRALMICTFVYIKYTHKLISKLEIVNYFSFNWIVKPCYNWSFYQFNGRKKLPPASLWLQNSVESESKGLLYAAKILWIEFNVRIHRVDLTELWRTHAHYGNRQGLLFPFVRGNSIVPFLESTHVLFQLDNQIQKYHSLCWNFDQKVNTRQHETLIILNFMSQLMGLQVNLKCRKKLQMWIIATGNYVHIRRR